jgi:hypothetical protein
MQINLDQIYASVDNVYQTNTPAPSYKQGKSIVTSMYSSEFVSGYILLKELTRLLHSLPVEVFCRAGELSSSQIQMLEAVDSKISVKILKGNAKDFTTPYGTKAGWSVKIHALYESEYQENLWIDSDNYPIRSVEFLFNDLEYQQKGSLFWRDVMSTDRANRYHDGAPLWQVFRVQPNDAEPFEAGQLLIDKVKCWPQFRLVKHYADNCEYYYHFGGDTETFRLAWQHHAARTNGYYSYINYHANQAQVPYGFMPYGPFHKGLPNQYGKWGGGTVMVQRDRAGAELFNHMNISKFKLDNNAINGDIQNENFYHAHIKTLHTLIGANHG